MHNDLNLILIQETDILINHKVKDLSQVTPVKDKCTEKIHKLSMELKDSFSKILITDGKKQIRLNDIIEVAPNMIKEQLILLQKNLKNISSEIYKNNFMNQKLLENSMKYISYMMKKFVEITSDDQTIYCERGYTRNLGGQQNFMSVVA
ncbi:MAG: flagellar export chaperone FlgN [Candidatus Margulisbacteria bacterium]|nr:flagellar export chaperone FlgN [Candidatus Margulisiibacteriota bacterium]